MQTDEATVTLTRAAAIAALEGLILVAMMNSEKKRRGRVVRAAYQGARYGPADVDAATDAISKAFGGLKP